MKRENQEGAIVVEATIALTAFMFLIVTILSITNICLAQAKIGTLVHGVAKDISHYSYIYTMAGLNEKEKALSGKADYARNSIEEVKNNSKDAFSAIESIGNVAMDDEFWSSMMYLIAEGGVNEVKGIALDKICKLAAEKRLGSDGKDADAYLVGLGIEEGIDGLDFMDSSFCSKGGDDIKIVVSYKVHVLELLGIDFDFNFEQCAYTKTWCAKTGASEGGSGESEETKGGTSEETDENDETKDEDEDDIEEDEEKEDEEESTDKKDKSVDEYVKDSTHNQDSPQVMLGNNTESQADKYDMTYLKLSDEDKAALEEQGNNAVWEVHKRYLEEQEFAGKNFVLSSNPYNATGVYAREIEWLSSRGYTFEFDPGIGMWKAVR